MQECWLAGSCASLVRSNAAAGNSWAQQPYHVQKMLFHLSSPQILVLTISLSSSSRMVPGLWEKSCDMDLSCPFVAEHSKTLVLYTSSSYVSTSNSVRKKLLWWRLRAAPICVYRAMNLEVSLIVWLFSRIIVIGSPLRILSFTTMIFFFGHIYNIWN